MIDLTKPVQTRDGRKVRVLCTDRKGSSNSIVGLIVLEGGKEYVQTWEANGNFVTSGDAPADLINVPDKRVVWVNMYPGPIMSAEASSRKQADNNATNNDRREACIRVEYEVGQFDEDKS